MRYIPLLVLPLVASALLQPPVAIPLRLYTAAEGYAWAYADVLGLTFEARQQALYVYAPTEPQDEVDSGLTQAQVSWLFNSYSSAPVILQPTTVAGSEGRLFRIDLDDYGITRKSIERLGELGSGRVPVPEPYYHETGYQLVTEYWPGGRYTDGKDYAAGPYKVRKQVQALAQGSPPEAALLVAETGSDFPLFRLDWLLYYGLLEPRYHELLQGVDKLDTLRDFERFAGVDDNESDREADVVRGQVNHSEVTLHNRALERRSLRRRYGRGYFWKSIDFASSIARDNLFADVLNERAAANELIFSLRNGLQAYGVVDGDGKRLDRAAIEVARDRRTPLSSPEVEVRNCVCCHPKGLNLFTDEVRQSSPGDVTLDIFAKGHKNPKDYARRVRDRYYATAVEPLLYGDQASYDQAVRACSGDKFGAEALALSIQASLMRYEQPLRLHNEKGEPLDTLPREYGYPHNILLSVLERSKDTGIDSHLAVLLLERPCRRDHFEVGFSTLNGLLAQVPRAQP